MNRCVPVAFAAPLLILSAAALAEPPTFELLPSVGPEPSGRVLARGVSGDGEVIFGSQVPVMWERAFTWRRIDGIWTLIALPNEGSFGWGRPVAASFDGDTIVGMTNLYMSGAIASGTPAIWTAVLSGEPAVVSPLDELPPYRRGCFGGVSADGSFAVATAMLRIPDASPGEFWGLSDSLTRLSPDPTTWAYASALLAGNAVSADGQSVAGSVYDGVRRTPFVWTGGGVFKALPIPATGSFRNARAECISRDASVVGGYITAEHTIYNTQARPCLWIGGVRVDLALAPGNADGRVFNVSGDGSIAVGVQYQGTLGFDSGTVNTSRAVFWFHRRPQLLVNYLTTRGIDLQGVTPNWITGVSDDGRTLVGFGTRNTTPTDHVSFRVTLPTTCLGDVTEDGALDFADYLEFLNLYDATDLRIDFTGDMRIDFADYLEFLNYYEQGC